MAIRCQQCGTAYDQKFNFCPNCSAVNPSTASSSKRKGSFQKVGESNAGKRIARSLPRAVVEGEEYYEDDYVAAVDEAEEQDRPAQTQEPAETETVRAGRITPPSDHVPVMAEPVIKEQHASEDEPGTKEPVKADQKKIDINSDGYYDDRLPRYTDELIKTNYKDIIIKAGLWIVGIAAIIMYCIYYVRV